MEKARELWSLPEGWNSHGAAVIQDEPIQRALSFLFRVMVASSPEPSMVPLSDGGVQLEWHTRGFDFELAFRSDGSLDVLYEEQGQEVENEEAIWRGVAALQWRKP